MKQSVNVAVVQMETKWLDRETNLAKILSSIDQICNTESTDLIVFPELCTTGYVKGRMVDFNTAFIKEAEPVPGPTTDALCEMSLKYHVHIVVGIARLHPVIPATLYNAAILINDNGGISGIHHKMHIPAEEKHYFYPGSTKEVFKTDLGNIGLLVCYDSEFPELSRILSLKGAEILVGVFNWGWPVGTYATGRLSRMAASRALENKNYFIACNKVGIEDENVFYGNSTIAGPDGEIMVEALPIHDDHESVLRAVLTEEAMLRERSLNTTFRNRRPDMYGELIEPF
jgi:predicted amidohydrolase